MSIKKDRNEKKEFNIIHYQKFLNEAEFQYFYNCYLDRSEGRYLSSIIWGAVFLETYLDDLLNQLNITRRDNENMKAMMDHLYGYLKTKSPDSLNIPIEIINKCHTIRTTRNSIVHKSDVKKEGSKIVADSDTVWNNLLMILDWYKETSI